MWVRYIPDRGDPSQFTASEELLRFMRANGTSFRGAVKDDPHLVVCNLTRSMLFIVRVIPQPTFHQLVSLLRDYGEGRLLAVPGAPERSGGSGAITL